MTDETVTTLDYIDNISVPGNVFAKPVNEYWALVCLHKGMEFLYRQADGCDELVTQTFKNVLEEGQLFVYGNLPQLDGVPKALLTCAFHWYAISAVQYVRLVGAIAHKHDSSRPLPKEYANGIIPEVVAFRDKVAAHFAWGTRNQRDNDAERLASVLPPLAFSNGTFVVGEMNVSLRQSGKVSTSESIQPWSLCRVHERLRERYWPAPTTDESAEND